MPELPPIPPVDWRDAARRFLAHYPEVNSASEVNHVIETMPNNGAQNVQDSSDRAKRSQDRSLLPPPQSAWPVFSGDRPKQS
jgi:hypothetical protein